MHAAVAQARAFLPPNRDFVPSIKAPYSASLARPARPEGSPAIIIDVTLLVTLDQLRGQSRPVGHLIRPQPRPAKPTGRGKVRFLAGCRGPVYGAMTSGACACHHARALSSVHGSRILMRASRDSSSSADAG